MTAIIIIAVLMQAISLKISLTPPAAPPETTERKCIMDFTFVQTTRGGLIQLIDAQGHGIPCSEESK